jgi:N-acetylmuramic acid 6-phosphate (MurNAc-6-P) etherase
VLILRTITGLGDRAAQDLLTGSNGELKGAIVASLAGTDAVGACELLARSGGIVHAVVEGNRFPVGDIS